MERVLMSVETVKIKNFIFSTNKLKCIKGASYLLDVLNQKCVKEILESRGIKENNNLDEEYLIYIGAGNAKFFVGGKTKEEANEKANNIKKEIIELYLKKAPNAKIIISILPVDEDQKIWDIIGKLGKEKDKNINKGFTSLNIDLPIIKKCELCNNQPAEEKVNDKFICDECKKKLDASKEIKDDKDEIGFYHEMKKELNMNTEANLEDYDEMNKNYIGFMYADGDGLGDFLKHSKDVFEKYKDEDIEKDYLTFTSLFSKTLDECTKKSLKETLLELKEEFKDKKGEKLIGEFLIVGGDDVCCIFSPQLVFEISKRFQSKFESMISKEMKLKLENKIENKKLLEEIKVNITSSCGIVIAKSKTPMFYLFDRALELQKSAKKKRHIKDSKETGYIDFQVIGSEGCVDIDEFRKKINRKNQTVMERPYAINEKKEGIKNFEDLLKLIIEMKSVNFPKSKIRYLYDLKRRDDLSNKDKKMEAIIAISKLEKKAVECLKNHYKIDINNYDDFEEFFNNIFDVLEIYDFIKEIKAGGETSENQI